MPPFYAAHSGHPGLLLRPKSASVSHIRLHLFFFAAGEQHKKLGGKGRFERAIWRIMTNTGRSPFILLHKLPLNQKGGYQ